MDVDVLGLVALEAEGEIERMGGVADDVGADADAVEVELAGPGDHLGDQGAADAGAPGASRHHEVEDLGVGRADDAVHVLGVDETEELAAGVVHPDAVVLAGGDGGEALGDQGGRHARVVELGGERRGLEGVARLHPADRAGRAHRPREARTAAGRASMKLMVACTPLTISSYEPSLRGSSITAGPIWSRMAAAIDCRSACSKTSTAWASRALKASWQSCSCQQRCASRPAAVPISVFCPKVWSTPVGMMLHLPLEGSW